MKKRASAAGTFYPSEKHELEQLIESFRIKEPEYYSRAVIIPHAGYVYSGKLAAKGIQQLKKDAKNVYLHLHIMKEFSAAPYVIMMHLKLRSATLK